MKKCRIIEWKLSKVGGLENELENDRRIELKLRKGSE